ncbi:excitatory amino acid transporter 3-like [Glandiceps talaboti]
MANLECSGDCMKRWFKTNLLLLLTLLGVVVGFVLAVILQPYDISDDAIMWIGLPGDLFMRALRCMVLPVLTASVITATASLQPKSNGKMSGITFAYILGSVFLGVLVGMLLSLAIQPGKRPDADNINEDYQPAYYETQDVIADLLRNVITDNIVKACLQSIYTAYTFGERNITSTNGTEMIVLAKSNEYNDSTNILGVLVFALAFGVSMCVNKEETRTMFNFMWSLRIISIKILTVLLWFLPIATASLICKSSLQVTDLAAVWTSLGLFVATVIAGLAIHVFITLPLIFFIITRRNPYLYMLRCSRAIVMAMVVKTNSATLPEIFRACEIRNHVHKSVSNFVVPLSVSFRADGSAVFIVCGAMWLAQSSNMSLNGGQLVTMFIVSWVMGNSLPSVPSASIVAIVTVCSAVGVPSDNIGLLLTMEWLLDSLRTGVNCFGHCSSAGIVDSIMGKEIQALEEDLEKKEPGDVKNEETEGLQNNGFDGKVVPENKLDTRL